VALLNESGKRCALVVFAVGQYHARFAWRDHVEPTHKISLSRVCAESAECVNRRFHRDSFCENLHFFLAIDKLSAQRALTLITDDNDVRAWLPEIGPEMMKNAAAVAHSRAGHDKTRAAHVIDCARFVDTVNDLIPNRVAFASDQRWSLESINTIDAYRGVSGQYYFPRASEFAELSASNFIEVNRHFPTYELGERCPTFVLSRK